MPITTSDYQAPGWCPGGHLQTVIPARLTPKPDVKYRREIVRTPDDDIVAWDWVDPANPAPETPVLVHFHGLEGGSNSHYALSLMKTCQARGWRGVVAHFRTCGGLMNIKPRAYFAGDSEDCSWVLKTVRSRFPKAPIYAVGVSLGGNQIAKCLGDFGQSASQFVDAAVAVCAPIDLVAGSERLTKGVNILYANMFLSTLKAKLEEKARQYPDLFDMAKVKQVQNMYDFDDMYTAPVHGYPSAMKYWQDCSAKPVLCDVRVPLLLLNARNDPFLPAWTLPDEAGISRAVTADFPQEGGHVGFPEGRKFPGDLEYLPRRIMHFFDAGS